MIYYLRIITRICCMRLKWYPLLGSSVCAMPSLAGSWIQAVGEYRGSLLWNLVQTLSCSFILQLTLSLAISSSVPCHVMSFHFISFQITSRSQQNVLSAPILILICHFLPSCPILYYIFLTYSFIYFIL